MSTPRPWSNRPGSTRRNRSWNRGSGGCLTGSSRACLEFLRLRRSLAVVLSHRSRASTTARTEATPLLPRSSSRARFAWRRWFRISSKKATRSSRRRNVAATAAIAFTATAMTAPTTSLTSSVAVSAIQSPRVRSAATPPIFWRYIRRFNSYFTSLYVFITVAVHFLAVSWQPTRVFRWLIVAFL